MPTDTSPSFDELAGRLRIVPGPTKPRITSTRRDWAALLTAGRPAAQVPDLLAGLFALCGDAHRHAARWALAAAQGRLAAFEADAVAQAEMREAVRADTLREHLRRLWLDWPRLVAGEPAPATAALAACPLLRPGGSVPASRSWIEQHVLGMPEATWILQWQADGAAFLRRWAEAGATAAARQLQAAWPLAGAWCAAVQPLHVHTDARAMRALAAVWLVAPGFVLQPLWQGLARETGPWTRLADRAPAGPANPQVSSAADTAAAMSAWERLASRVPDLALLAAEGGQMRLQMGGLELDAGGGLGWCEMARGLLVHRVQLDGECVREWSVLAPTEWNFHPEGVLAGLLAQLPADAPAAAVRLLAACFDPCVPVHAAGAP